MQFAKLKMSSRFNLATSGVKNFPFAELPVSLEEFELSTSGAYGYEPLLHEISHRYEVAKENIVTSLGTSMANFLVFASLLERGDEILVEHPTYELLLSAAEFFRVNIKRFHRTFENGFQIDVRELEKKISNKTRLIILANLHNPSSVFIEENVLKQIGEIAKTVGARVLVDEVYLDAMFEKKPQTSFLLGNEFIVTNSLTKVYGLGGLRCGWIFAETELAQKFWQFADLLYVNHAHIAERLSVAAFHHLEKIAERSRLLLNTNREIITRFFESQKNLDVIKPAFGTTYFPRLNNGNIEQLCLLLREQYETTIVPGSFFEMPQHFRVGIGGETENLQEGLERLGKALKEI